MQIIVPGAPEVGKTQKALDQQNILQQQQFADQWQQIADKRQHQVQNLSKSENGKVQRDKHDKEDHHAPEQEPFNKERKQAHQVKDLEESPKDPVRGNHIDIKT
jgi:hypothetical protein